MGALITLNNVTTDTAKNTGDEDDWARGYTLELSKNGSSWTTVATGVGTRKATTIAFLAQSARYFRLTQTGSAGKWWSIGELTAGLYNDDYSLNNTITTASAPPARRRSSTRTRTPGSPRPTWTTSRPPE